MEKTSKVRVVTAFFVGLILLIFNGLSAAATDMDKYGGVLKEVLRVGPATPIGYPVEAAPDAQAVSLPTLETLVRVTSDGQVEPLLARNWQVGVDRKSIKFFLQRNVQFHDGTVFNAQAVKWNFDKIIEAKRVRGWDSVEVVDDYTLRVKVQKITNIALSDFGRGTFAIISPSAVEKNGLDWARWHPVGTGPFKFVSYERDAKLIFKRNNEYWREGLPYLDGIEFIVLADDTVQKIAFQRGDIHRLQASPLTAMELKNMGFPYLALPFGSFVLIPDSKNSESPLAKKKVRLAISHALDREALAQGLGHGFANPAYQLFPGFSETRIPNFKRHEFDIQKARQLLTEAGYPNGFEISIRAFIRIVPRDYISAIASMLGQVGIRVTMEFPEAGRYSEYRFKGWQNGMLGHALAAFSNKNSSLSIYFGGIQFPSVQKPEKWDEVYNAAMDSVDFDPGKTQALIQLIHDDVMVIPYLEEIQVSFYQKGVNIPEMKKYGTLSYFREESWLSSDLR